MFIDYQGNNMEQEIVTKPHPYIEGLLVRSDGMVYVPESHRNKAHWTKGTRTNKGYNIRFKRKSYRIHRLVLETFKPNIEKLLYVDFNDGNCYNTNLDNLSWTNYTKNHIIHRFKNKASMLNKTLASICDTKDDFDKLYQKAKRILHPGIRESNKQWYEKHKDDQDFKQKNHENSKQWYEKHKDDPDFKQEQREKAQKYREEHKGDLEYKQKQNESRKRRREKHKDDPDYKQKKREGNKRWYEKRKDDPDYKQKKRESSKRSRAKKKLIKQGLTEIV